MREGVARTDARAKTFTSIFYVLELLIVYANTRYARARSWQSHYRSFVTFRSRFVRSSSSRHSPRAAHSAAPKYANVVMYDAT